jgi:hypothetical protein
MKNACGASRNPMICCPFCGDVKPVVLNDDGTFHCEICNKDFNKEKEDSDLN